MLRGVMIMFLLLQLALADRSCRLSVASAGFVGPASPLRRLNRRHLARGVSAAGATARGPTSVRDGYPVSEVAGGNDHGGIPVGAVMIAAAEVENLRGQLERSLRPPISSLGSKVDLSLRGVEPLEVELANDDGGGGIKRPKQLLLVHLPTAAAAALDDGACRRGKELMDFLKARGATYLPGLRRPRTLRGATKKRRGAHIVEVAPTSRRAAANSNATAAFTFTELFAGIGGFRLGLEELGGRCVVANEIDPYAAATYSRHFESDQKHESMIEADILDICARTDVPKDVDVLTAGFPCQPFTSRGSQAGLADDRGLLYREVVRILRGSRPKSFVLENVLGLVRLGGGGGGRGKSKERGEAGSVLSHMLEAFEGCGYKVSWNVCNGRHWGPQQRERVFIVGTRVDLGCSREFQWDWYDELRGGVRDGERPVSSTLVVRDILEPPDAASVRECELTAGQWEKVRALHADTKPMGIARARIDLDAKSPTLISSYRRIGSLTSKYVFEERDGTSRDRPRFLTPRECCRIMGFPEDFAVPSAAVDGDEIVGHFYAGIGNAVIPPVVSAVGEELMKVLDSAVSRSSAYY
ncbi:hypothetical protein TrST_g11119 [Triparma strigata]|uniref:DNA (cytosine-5-)-methyltransferase n=1 Tax=Triparma strigata TaxID=1606541 RepID=A0A9W7AWZ4_9STRA|nr:hypothetical protein TrST_g11119 [Triparma strigata]